MKADYETEAFYKMLRGMMSSRWRLSMASSNEMVFTNEDSWYYVGSIPSDTYLLDVSLFHCAGRKFSIHYRPPESKLIKSVEFDNVEAAIAYAEMIA